MHFARNVILQGANRSTVLFEGNFAEDAAAVHHYNFTGNAYASDVHNLTAGFPAFGGISARMCPKCDPRNTSQTGKAAWDAWRSVHGQDALGVVVSPSTPVFADPNWADSWNLTLNPGGPVALNQANGFVPFDATVAGLLPS